MQSAVCVSIALLMFTAGVRASPGANCSTDTSACVDTTETCDDGNCKAAPGADCDADSNPCGTGYTCDSKCKGNPGSHCEGSTIECKTGHTCESTVCKINKDGNCTGNTDQCVTGTACDTAGDNTCKAAPGADCAADNPCGTGYTCDTKCKGNAGSHCEGSSIECKTGHTCELNVCKINAGQSCTDQSHFCVKGATCKSSTCKCVDGVATLDSSTGTCKPAANKIYGACNSTAGQRGSCTDPHAECNSGTCSCSTSGTTRYVVDPSDLSCGLGVDGDCSSDSNLCIAGTVCEGTCKKAVGTACAGTGAASKCPANADCKSGKCECDKNYSATSDGKCAQSPAAASGLAVSSVLMLLALITTRL